MAQQALTQRLVDLFAAQPQVEAVALGGSRTNAVGDSFSDIDLYVYTRSDIPLEERRLIVQKAGGASRADLGLLYWGPGDEWFDAESGTEVDVVYFDIQWMQAQIDRILRLRQPGLGYSTCFWHTILQSQPLYDPYAWYAGLLSYCQQPYPEDLRQNIVAFNHPVLRSIIPAYAHQLEKAFHRHDLVSINHRLAALLASYFDVIFAVNRLPHPGEKRLISLVQAHCHTLPPGMVPDLEALLAAASGNDDHLLQHLSCLLDRLDAWLAGEGFSLAGSS